MSMSVVSVVSVMSRSVVAKSVVSKGLQQQQRRRRPAGRPIGAWLAAVQAGDGGGAGGGGARPMVGARQWSGPPVQPVALALAADAVDFRRLGHHGILGGADFPGYLGRTERQLRALIDQGLEVHLRVLEPADFVDFCAVHGLSPQEAAARVAYAADPELAGDPFVYGGESLAELLPDLVEDHLTRIRLSVAYQALRAGLGRDDEAGQAWHDRLAAVLEHVTAVYRALVAGLGEGCHHLLLRVGAAVGGEERGEEGGEDGGEAGGEAGGEEYTAAVELCAERGRLFVPARDAEAFCVTLAAGLTPGRTGELLVHSTRRERPRSGRGRPRTVRGWALAAGRLAPLDADGVRGLLARSPAPGGPGGPARVRPGFALPDPPGRPA